MTSKTRVFDCGLLNILVFNRDLYLKLWYDFLEVMYTRTSSGGKYELLVISNTFCDIYIADKLEFILRVERELLIE